MKYIILLRGINVSGKNIIKMAPFRELLAGHGFKNINTYIQSGNISLEANVSTNLELENKISKIIKEEYGYIVPVIARDKKYVNKVISDQPYDLDTHDFKRLAVTFLENKPSNDKIEALRKYDFSPDKFTIFDDIVYVFCPTGFGKTKITNVFFEKKLGVKATSRNWRTSLKLKNMLD